MSNVLIRYIWNERAEEKWLFWLEKKLSDLGFNVSVESLKKPKSKTHALISEIQQAHAISEHKTYIAPHDPGCLSILKYMERIHRIGELEPSLLVAGTPTTSSVMFPTEATSFAQLAGPKGMIAYDPVFALDQFEVKLIILYGGSIGKPLENKEVKRISGK